MSKQDKFAGVDFHCHLDLYPEHEGAISRAETSRIFTLTVTTTPKA
jgi:TatD DNase family protein